MNRRNFLKLGALFVPVVAAPTVAYSFLWAPSYERADGFDDFQAVYDALMRELAICLQIPEHILRGQPATQAIVHGGASLACDLFETTRLMLEVAHP